MFYEGQWTEQVVNTLNTGELLSYSQSADVLSVTSVFTLNTESCMIYLTENGTVSEVQRNSSVISKVIIPGIAVIVTALLAIFQLLLALGLPWGEYAWGGFHRRLPMKLRIGSALSALIFIFAAVCVLSATEGFQLIPQAIYDVALPLFTVMFLFSVIGNFNSVSEKEKRVMIPASLLLFCSYFFITINLIL
jgi:hypothetical protein